MATGIKNFVDDYGGVGNNSTNNATAWANALADMVVTVSGVKYARYALYMPPGVYDSSTGFKATGVKNLTIFGAGGTDPGAFAQGGTMTVLQNSSAVTGVMEFDGCADLCVSDICVNGSSSYVAQNGIWLHWNPNNTALGSTRNCFSNVTVTGRYVTGWRIGGDGSYYDPYQEDQNAFYRCKARGQWAPGDTTYWQAGWIFGAGVVANNLIHAAYYLDSVAHKYGVRVSSTGPVSIFGGILQSNDWDLYTGNQNGAVYVQGIRSEVGRSGFLFHSSAQSAPMPVTIAGCEYSGDSSSTDNGYGYAAPIWIDGPGPVIIDDFRTFKYPAGTKPRIHIQAGKRIVVHVRGLQIQNTEATEVFKSNSATDVASCATLESFTRCNDDLTALEYLPGPVLWNGKGSITTRSKLPIGGIESFSHRTNVLKLAGVASAPATPNISVVGTTGATTYQYKIVFKDARGNKSLPSATVSVANGNATLSTTNYVRVTSSNNQYDLEPVFVDLLKWNSGSAVWQALYKDVPVTEWYAGLNDDGRAVEDAASYTLPTCDEMGDVLIEGCIELSEQANAPATPAANRGRLYVRDNGAGKTELVIKYPSGAVNVIDTEP